MPPPTTLRGMWDSASIVVYGVISSTGSPELVGGGPLVARVHTLRLLEVLKNSSKSLPSGSLRVRQFGGTVVVNKQEVSTKYPDVILRSEGAYVLFLSQAPSSDSYEVVFGSAGAFGVDQTGAAVRVPQVVRQRMPEFSGRETMDRQELLTLLRSFRDGRERETAS